MKIFKKTFKSICDSCGEFLHTDTQYCEKCGAETVRKATKEDYSKYEIIAEKKHKESKKESEGLKREDDRVKKEADKVKKEADRVKKEARKAEKEAKKEAERAEKKIRQT